MNDIGHIFSASTIGTVAFGGASSTGLGDTPQETVQPFLNSQFNIIQISTLNPGDPAYLTFAGHDSRTQLARKLQAAIIATPKAMKQLIARHVDVTSIVGLMQSTDGTTTLYIAD